nr:hypothetical protein [Chryseolinea sp.]
MIFTIIILFSFTCWLSSLILLRKKQAGYLHHMTWFLGLTTMAELSGYLVYFQFHQKNNYWVFNAFLPVEVFFLSWLFYKILSPYCNCKPWILAGLTVFFTIYLYESFQSSFLGLSMNAKNFSSVFIIVICLSYYYFLLKSEEYIRLKTHAPFWIVTGCFFFYFGSVTCDIFFDHLLSINKVTIKPVRYVIFIVLNFILYSSWS